MIVYPNPLNKDILAGVVKRVMYKAVFRGGIETCSECGDTCKVFSALKTRWSSRRSSAT